MRNALFFIAIIPPHPIRNEVHDYKILMDEKYSSKRALNSPPHITIFPPFRWSHNQMEKLLIPLYEIAESVKPFYITLNGFDHFSNKVLFIDVDKNIDLANVNASLNNKLPVLLNTKKDTRKFNPHMTIGFKDLTPENFQLSWQYFKTHDYLRVFEVKSFHLLAHDGKRWNPLHKFSFNR